MLFTISISRMEMVRKMVVRNIGWIEIIEQYTSLLPELPMSISKSVFQAFCVTYGQESKLYLIMVKNKTHICEIFTGSRIFCNKKSKNCS